MTLRSHRVLAGLSLRQKAAQLVMPRIPGAPPAAGSPESARLRSWVSELQVGGFVVSAAAAATVAALLDSLQERAPVPLLIAADMEQGAGQVLHGATRFPPAMGIAATGDVRLAYELGRVTAVEARAAGVHVVFAPVADIAGNPANPIVSTRSYGADPGAAARFVAEHVRGLQEHGALAVAKHFPGHGDTTVDSHLELAHSCADRARLDAVELPPFRAAIGAGVAGIMTAHVAYPAVTGGDVPATLHADLVTGLLRTDLGFDGLVFTDALDMGAIARTYGAADAAVRAFAASADVLLQPEPDDVGVVIDALAAAVADGRVSPARLDEAVLRVLAAKDRLRLHERTPSDGDALDALLGAETRIAEDAAARSITLLPGATALPLRGRLLVVVYTPAPDPAAGGALADGLAETHAVRTLHVDATSDAAALDRVAEAAAGADAVIIAAFVRVGPGQASTRIAEPVAARINALAARTPLVVVACGSPAFTRQLDGATTCLLAWSQTEMAQRAAARTLAGPAGAPGVPS